MLGTAKFRVTYKGVLHIFEATSLYAAKKKAIAELKVPMSKWSSLSIMAVEAYENGDFMFN